MSIPSGKKILLLGFVIVLLVAIPVTVYLVQQQQKTRSSATPATVLSLQPTSQTVTLQKDVSLDMNVDPSFNLVSFIKVLITYDATKLATDGAGFVPNTVAFPSVLQPPTYGPGTISFTVSIGGSPQNAIQKPTKVGTVTFKAIATTDAAPTQITFGNQTQVLSIGSTDQFNENILSTTSPASVIITAGEFTPTDTPVPTNTPEPTFTPEPTNTPVPTDTPVPSVTPIATDTPVPGATLTPTNTPTPTVIAAGGPVCTTLTLDRSSTGVVPYNVNITANGTSDTSTISKVTFAFGDGQTQDVTDSGGIGTNSVSALVSHIYNTAGAFTATATLTDANGLASNGGCSVIVTVGQSGTTPAEIAAIPSPSPLPPTGPANIISIGLIGLVLTLIGAVLIFAL